MWGFPGGSEGKESACNVGDPALVPGLGRSPGEGNGNPLQYSCLENSMDGGACWAMVHGVTELCNLGRAYQYKPVSGVCLWVKWRQLGMEIEQVWEGRRFRGWCGRVSEESLSSFIARTEWLSISERHVHTWVGWKEAGLIIFMAYASICVCVKCQGKRSCTSVFVKSVCMDCM